MSRRRPRTFTDRYSADYLAALDAMLCEHGEPRGARYCPLCRRLMDRLRSHRHLETGDPL